MTPADLTEFCTAEWPRLVGALSLYTGDADLAEELAQEAVARACRHWRRVRAAGRAGRMAAPGRAQSRPFAFPSSAQSWRARNGARRGVPSWSRRTTTRSRCARSSPRYRTRERDAIVLRYYLGYSVRETALELDVPEGTVKTLTHRAVARLRESGFIDEEIVDA